jgi:hypothetical protein
MSHQRLSQDPVVIVDPRRRCSSPDTALESPESTVTIALCSLDPSETPNRCVADSSEKPPDTATTLLSSETVTTAYLGKAYQTDY